MDELVFFSIRQNKIGKYSNLLGSPLRAAIIEQIARNNSSFEQEFLLKHQISISMLKKNLRALNKGGIIKSKSLGKNKGKAYILNWERMQEFKGHIDDFYYEIRAFQKHYKSTFEITTSI